MKLIKLFYIFTIINLFFLQAASASPPEIDQDSIVSELKLIRNTLERTITLSNKASIIIDKLRLQNELVGNSRQEIEQIEDKLVGIVTEQSNADETLSNLKKQISEEKDESKISLLKEQQSQSLSRKDEYQRLEELLTKRAESLKLRISEQGKDLNIYMKQMEEIEKQLGK